MQLHSHYLGALAALAMAVSIGGCDTGTWFTKPVDMFGTRHGYSYSELGDARRDRPITANDLVDANGACPPPVTPPASPGAVPPAPPDTAALLGAGVSVGMSECDVVFRAGQPSAVNLGMGPNGDRTAVLTFNTGPRAGIYRFVGGRLTEMDSIGEPQPPPQPDKKNSKAKKTAKSNYAT